MNELTISTDSEILTLLRQGEKEIAERVGYDLEEILAEADQLINEIEPRRLDCNGCDVRCAKREMRR